MPAPQPRDPMDTLATIGLCAVLIGVCWFGLMLSGLAVMGVPPCPAHGACLISTVEVGMYLEWASIAAAVIVTAAGITRALFRHRTAAGWPALGIGLAVVGTGVAVALMNSGWGHR